MSLTYRLASKHLPFPRALKLAVEQGHVHPAIGPGGQAAFTIDPECPNLEAVMRALETRKQWQLWVARAEGALTSVALVAIAALAGSLWYRS